MAAKSIKFDQEARNKLLAGVDHQSFVASAPTFGGDGGYGGYGPPPPAAVWSDFMARGFVTFLLEEMHDGCSDLSAPSPSSAAKLFFSKLGERGMPHHNAWQIFCAQQLRQCCDDPDSFLNPGRRQCVDGRDLHEVLPALDASVAEIGHLYDY